nr:movement protein [Chrysanthemum yellow edge associated virus 1]
MSNIEILDEHNDQNHTGIINISNFENQGTIFKDILIDSAKIRKTNFDLKSKHNFQTSLIKSFTNLFNTKNVLYFGTMFGEEPVPIETTQGDVRIPLINKQQLINKIKKTNKPSHLFGYVHISTIQILLKSTFARGIDSPITLELFDNRFINTNNALISTGSGNLQEGLLKFDINIQTSVAILDKHLEDAVILKYKLEKTNFMKQGNHPFSVAYKINYALSNSHHSMTYKTDDTIKIDTLFTPLLKLNTPDRSLIARSTSRIQYDNQTRKLIKPVRPIIPSPPVLQKQDSTRVLENIQNSLQEIQKRL